MRSAAGSSGRPWPLRAVIVASVLGLVMGVGWALVVKNWNSPFGFGPAIAAAALVALLLPDLLFLAR